MKPLPYIDELVASASTPLSKLLFERFADSLRDKSFSQSDYPTLLREVMEKSLTENDTDAAS